MAGLRHLLGCVMAKEEVEGNIRSTIKDFHSEA